MSSTKKGWQQQLMISAFEKESPFDSGVAMTAAEAFSFKNFDDLGVEWPDTVATDKDEVTNTEHGTDQVIIEQRTKFSLAMPKAKPNDVAAIASLVLGSTTPTKDGAFDAYTHKIIPVTVGTAIPSVQLEHKKGGIQYAYKGVKGSSLELSCEAGGLVALAAELMGSGTRDTSATAFAAAISEGWLMANRCNVWMESGAEISITAGAMAQAAEDISSATPEDLKARLRSFNVKFNNNPEELPGFGGAGVLQDIDYVRRAIELSFSLQFSDDTELNHFINQDPMAIEFDLTGGTLIDAGGSIYPGIQILIPRFKIKSAPHPQGGPGDSLTLDIECDVQDDGTNDPIEITAYTAQAAYMG